VGVGNFGEVQIANHSTEVPDTGQGMVFAGFEGYYQSSCFEGNYSPIDKGSRLEVHNSVEILGTLDYRIDGVPLEKRIEELAPGTEDGHTAGLMTQQCTTEEAACNCMAVLMAVIHTAAALEDKWDIGFEVDQLVQAMTLEASGIADIRLLGEGKLCFC